MGILKSAIYVFLLWVRIPRYIGSSRSRSPLGRSQRDTPWIPSFHVCVPSLWAASRYNVLECFVLLWLPLDLRLAAVSFLLRSFPPRLSMGPFALKPHRVAHRRGQRGGERWGRGVLDSVNVAWNFACLCLACWYIAVALIHEHVCSSFIPFTLLALTFLLVVFRHPLSSSSSSSLQRTQFFENACCCWAGYSNRYYVMPLDHAGLLADILCMLMPHNVGFVPIFPAFICSASLLRTRHS